MIPNKGVGGPIVVTIAIPLLIICCHSPMNILFSLFSMTPLGNAKNVLFLRCRLLVNMTNGLKLSYY